MVVHVHVHVHACVHDVHVLTVCTGTSLYTCTCTSIGAVGPTAVPVHACKRNRNPRRAPQYESRTAVRIVMYMYWLVHVHMVYVRVHVLEPTCKTFHMYMYYRVASSSSKDP